ncbi:MAG: ATP-dependent RecD-like DNA helicase [Clostridia bacterium]|nr:ATP-dependent RecD-like DNA helicase [Clostridia bacterium]
MSEFEEQGFMTEDGLVCLEGTVERVIYYNEENAYGICEFAMAKEMTTIVGTLPYVGEGEHLSVFGRWVHNPKYGRQFRVERFEKQLPADVDSILRYLASGAVKGIGVKRAAKIVDEFGEDTFDVIENHPEWLAQIPGISRKKAEEISENFKAESGMRSTMLFFREYFGSALSVKIYKTFGPDSVAMTKENPYILCDHVDGIDFAKADNIASKYNISRDSENRVMSGILYVLNKNSHGNGHVCLPVDELTQASAQLLGVENDAIVNAYKKLIIREKLRIMKSDGRTYAFTKEAYDAEQYIAKKLDSLDRLCFRIDYSDIERFILREESKFSITYAPLQRKAISMALENGVMVLTGGPGTGKTTVVRALLNIFESMDMRVALAAPTGRAAKRLSESTSKEAKTIHRLLEMEYGEGDRAVFMRDEHNLLDENVIIVDEASMIDNALMCALLKAVKPGARMVIIGDSDQLPSVGAGNVLRDIIASQRFATVTLNTIFRQAQESLIVTNSHAINEGRMPDLTSKNKDFFFLHRSSDAEIAHTIADLYKNRLPASYGAETVNKIQVITPSRRGEAGTDNLNVLLQGSLNPKDKSKREKVFRDKVFREGDRVMQTKNNYDIEWENASRSGVGIFNGDIGVICEIDQTEQYMEILFDDRRVLYDFSLLEDLEHAYAVTVHKSQGSEYPIVIIPMYSCPPMLMTRNLLYTAVTRAQEMVILVGREDYVQKMVENDRKAQRYTCLQQRLAEKK